MKKPNPPLPALLLALLLSLPAASGQADATATDAGARVLAFSPAGEVHHIRQATARFSEPMVEFGDPRAPSPFDITCSEPGQGHWAGPRDWVYDFARDLPGDVRCSFAVHTGLHALSGAAIAPARFAFDTGGPEVLKAFPVDGEDVDENQAFLLGLSAPADAASVRSHAWCAVDGIAERVPVEPIEGHERAVLLDQRKSFAREWFEVLGKNGLRGVLALRDDQLGRLPVATLRCARPLPSGRKLRLVWGPGILGPNGGSTRQEQALAYQVRKEFRASLDCTRLDPKGGCVPVSPLVLEFTAPVSRGFAAGIRLRTADGQQHLAKLDGTGDTVERVSFAAPFPDASDAEVTLPANLHDDAGRPLANLADFPLRVRIDPAPPLLKFGAPFGILEAHADPALPVAVRNVESQLDAVRSAHPVVPGASGQLAHLARDDDAAIADWYFAVTEGHRRGERGSRHRDDDGAYVPEGSLPLLHGAEDPALPSQPLTLPPTRGDRALELVGIPLPGPGLYVVEFASPRLGAALLPTARPYYVHAGALVTNLSIHFKEGAESSLAWVTRLDNARPVAGVEVHVADCLGHVQWSGKTDAQGIAHIDQQLPQAAERWRDCPRYGQAHLVTARSGDDVSFMLTSWKQGLEPWQFNIRQWNLEPAGRATRYIAHTVTDRPLFRAGETVSMKHFLRLRTGLGFALPADGDLPTRAELRHAGSDEHFDLPLSWKNGQASSTWQIPAEAKLGTYDIVLRRDQRSWPSGMIRVEHYRVPLMKAVLQGPSQPVVRPEGVDIDAQLSYLAGGPAGDTSVKVRSQLLPRTPDYPDYPDYSFFGELPREGITTEVPDFEYEPDSDSEDAAGADEAAHRAVPGGHLLATQQLALDRQGGRRVHIGHLPRMDVPQDLQVEMEYLDPNGAILTAATTVQVLPSAVVLGIRTGAGYATQDALAFRVVALDAAGQPLSGQAVRVDAWTTTTYAYRKRLLGGFYGFEQTRAVHRAGPICSGRTDEHGLLLCEGRAPAKGELTLVAQAQDAAGNGSVATAGLYVTGEDDWFASGASDRIDLLADRLSYEPGQTAHLQVRMPFREATALVTVEREGVLATQVVRLQGRHPVVDVPVLASYGPNTYVSVLALRGRIDPEQPGVFAWLRHMIQRIGHWLGVADPPAPLLDTRPTAMVDLTRPAFRLGLVPLRVGWQGYTLAVKVETDRDAYRVRDHVHARIRVTDGQGRPAAHASVALAAVDEGLLALAPATSWQLLDAMMAPRALEVATSTAQSQVVGRRHFGRKAVPAGGGGGAANARELFDTLLYWRPEIAVDGDGRAEVDIPLNDSLTAFRVEAIAAQGAGQFGSGGTRVHTTQDVMLFAGLAPLVREGDRFETLVTVRNASRRELEVDVRAVTRAGDSSTDAGTQSARLEPGQARVLDFPNRAPVGVTQLDWAIDAQVRNARGAGTSDQLRLVQQVAVAVPVRVLERTLERITPGQGLRLPVRMPAGAVPGRGGVDVRLASSLGGDLESLRRWFVLYPWDCIEQQASRAVAGQDAAEWQAVMGRLPSYLDADGLVRYFPSSMLQGDEVLTSYLLAISDEAGYAIPQEVRDRMLTALRNFVQGRIHHSGQLEGADLMLRRLTALEALSRHGTVTGAELSSIDVAPDRWPSSALLDWLSLLSRARELPDREALQAQARGILRARLMWSGTRLTFSTEKSDALWWLMVSPDLNAVRALRLLCDDPTFRDDLPRLARGAIERQHGGYWSTTVANAWGVLALKRFRERFEHDPVTGSSRVSLDGTTRALDWSSAAKGPAPAGTLAASLPWPVSAGTLEVRHEGGGSPWAFVTSSAAVPLAEPLFAGLRVQRTLAPVEQKTTGHWTRGDVYEVTLALETQSDETWVALEDPVPAGGTILGSGLGGDSALLAGQDADPAFTPPVFLERRAGGCVAYWSRLAKGHHLFRYRVRLNAAGHFTVPGTHAEAMYAPEVLASLPPTQLTVEEPR